MKTPFASAGYFSVVIIVMMWWIPESPRCLVNRGREDKALEILSYYHLDNNAEDELVQLDLEEGAEVDYWIGFLRTKGNRQRIGIITTAGSFSQWSRNGLISYYLYQVMNHMGMRSPKLNLESMAASKHGAYLSTYLCHST